MTRRPFTTLTTLVAGGLFLANGCDVIAGIQTLRGPCERDSNCESQHCIDGVCALPCESSDTCPEDQFCNTAAEACYPKKQKDTDCVGTIGDDECLPGFCVDGVCCASTYNITEECWHCGEVQNKPNTCQQLSDITSAPRCHAPRIAAGRLFTCSIDCNGSAYCWGVNLWGNLGRPNSTGFYDNSYVPYLVTHAEQFSSIAVGENSTCALTNTGDVYCWGAAAQGPGWPSVEVQLPAPPTTAISAKTHKFCALSDTGDIYCWATHENQPLDIVQVEDIKNAKSLSTGKGFVCAITANDTVQCWGENLWGQLGNGNYDDSPKPTDVVGLHDVTQIAAGDYHTCAIAGGNGSVYCWGEELPNLPETDADRYSTPRIVPNMTNAWHICSGSGHSCAILQNGTAKCWGWNPFGNLGNGTTDSSANPVTVKNLSNVTAISCGNGHACAMTGDGKLYCWGLGEDGQLGICSTYYQLEPVEVDYNYQDCSL